MKCVGALARVGTGCVLLARVEREAVWRGVACLIVEALPDPGLYEACRWRRQVQTLALKQSKRNSNLRKQFNHTCNVDDLQTGPNPSRIARQIWKTSKNCINPKVEASGSHRQWRPDRTQRPHILYHSLPQACNIGAAVPMRLTKNGSNVCLNQNWNTDNGDVEVRFVVKTYEREMGAVRHANEECNGHVMGSRMIEVW